VVWSLGMGDDVVQLDFLAGDGAYHYLASVVRLTLLYISVDNFRLSRNVHGG
jgi:hypothetical protein